MTSYEVVISDLVFKQIDDYIDYIMFNCKAPMTASKHYEELFKYLHTLEKTAHLNPVRHTKYLQRNYGFYVRRLNFKNMTFIYSIYADNVVYIHQFLPQKSILD